MGPARFALVLALVAGGIACGGRTETVAPRAHDATPSATPDRSETAAGSGHPAVEPKPETIDAVWAALSTAGKPSADEPCGPYRALSSAPDEYLDVCRALADPLDPIYQARFGVTIPHPAAGLIVVFGSADRFRSFAEDFGGLRAGYAGFTLASRGVVAALAEDNSLDLFATVLGHELAHLVHRRVFGFNLAPWLSEGLADALGDTATPSGFGELRGIEGVEPLAARLDLAIEAGRAEPAANLVAKTRASFDQGVVSYDYESSALLVRFLLLDPELSTRFRKALRRLASAQSCDADCMFETLGVPGSELDRRFRRWLTERVERQP